MIIVAKFEHGSLHRLGGRMEEIELKTWLVQSAVLIIIFKLIQYAAVC